MIIYFRKTGLLIAIFLLSFCLESLPLFSQEKPIQLEIGSIKSTLRQNAIALGIRYIKSVDSLFKSQDILMSSGRSLFQVAPQFNVLSGTGDAFSSINARISGIFMTFHDTTISGMITPNTARGFNTFPISAGLESNNKFNIVNGIAEIGWVPWYQTKNNKKTPEFLKHTRFGIFIQGGYKFKVDTTGNTASGGEKDQGKEKSDNGLFRVKGRFGITTGKIFEINGIDVLITGDSDVWYDILNDEVYYSIIGKARFCLTKGKDKFFDLNYQKGSGAPNFNKGDQFGMGLVITF